MHSCQSQVHLTSANEQTILFTESIVLAILIISFLLNCMEKLVNQVQVYAQFLLCTFVFLHRIFC